MIRRTFICDRCEAESALSDSGKHDTASVSFRSAIDGKQSNYEMCRKCADEYVRWHNAGNPKQPAQDAAMAKLRGLLDNQSATTCPCQRLYK